MNSIDLLDNTNNFRDHFFNHGYCVIKDIFKPSELAKLSSDMSYLATTFKFVSNAGSGGDALIPSNLPDDNIDSILTHFEDNDRKHLHKFQIAASSLTSLYALVAQVESYACRLYDPNIESTSFLKGIGLVLGLPNTQRLSYGWHQDSSYYPQMEARNLVHIWFPIFRPAIASNGAMSFLKDSHKSGQINFSRIKPEAGGYTTCLTENVARLIENFEEVSVDISPGDCVFFHSHLIHKSNPNVSSFARIAGVMKFTCEPISNIEPSIVGI